MDIHCITEKVEDIFEVVVGLQTFSEAETLPLQPLLSRPGSQPVGRKRLNISPEELVAKKEKRLQYNREHHRIWRESAHGQVKIKANRDKVIPLSFSEV